MTIGRSLRVAVPAGLLLVTAAPAVATVVPDDYPTIQAAINAVVSGALPNGSTIDVRSGTYGEALSIRDHAKSMTLRARDGAGTVTVNAAGKNASAVTVWNATGTIRIQGLRFTGGRGDAGGGTGGGLTVAGSSPAFEDCTFDANSSLLNGGGGLIWASSPTFLRCRFTNNTTVRFGGGLVITGGSRPTFVGCTFQGNTAGTGSATGSGGAIHANDSSPTLRGCVVSSNQAKFAGGGIFHLGVFGSANGTATLEVEDSEVSGNTASRASPADNPAEGGGIHIEDNALGRVVRSRVKSNVANTGGGLNAYRARYEIEGSIVEGNQAPDPSNVGGFGGGIQASSNNPTLPLRQASTVVLDDTVVRNNTARIGGGIFVGGDFACAGCTDATATKASLVLTGSLVDSNTATKQAGGIYAGRSTVTVSGGLVSRNRNNAGDGFGGGLMLANGTSATLGGVRVARNEASAFGGGIFADANATVSVSGSAIYANSAGNTGGGIFVGSNGTNAGTVRTSALVDNVGTTIAEQCPSPATAGRLGYLDNTIVSSLTPTVYDGVCNPPGPLTVAGLNGLSNSSGNTGTLSLATVQSLAYFGVTPDVFPAVLAWSVIRATGVSIAPPVSPAPSGDTGTVDVAGVATVDYSFSATSPLGGVGPIAGSASPPAGTTVDVTFASQPSGLSVTVNGSSLVTPATVASPVGFPLTAAAPFSATSGPSLYLFSSWDGVLANPLTVVTPSSPATYTARYQQSVDVGPLDYHTLAPCRVLDTRWPTGAWGGPALAARSSRTFTAWGVCEVPTTARAVSLNVTATGATAPGHLRLHPADQLVPGTSVLNFNLGATRANNAVLGLSPAGEFTIYCGMASGSTHVVVDVNGYYE